MKAIVIDLGRSAIRYGVVENGKVRGYRKPVPPGPFEQTVRDMAYELRVDLKHAVVAIAAPGPFIGGRFRGLNMPEWDFTVDELRAALNCRVIVIHDVIGGALGVAHQSEDDKRLVAGRKIIEEPNRILNPRAFVQTGVGLGAAVLLPMPDRGWLPVSGEGGSIVLAPLSHNEELVFNEFRTNRRQFGFPTAQELLSTESIGSYARSLGGSYEGLEAKEIFERARHGDDDCRKAMMVYAGFLGSFAGAVALMYRSYDGLAIAGILPPLLTDRAWLRFNHRLVKRGTAGKQLKDVPMYSVTNEYNTLVGLASLVDGWGRNVW